MPQDDDLEPVAPETTDEKAAGSEAGAGLDDQTTGSADDVEPGGEPWLDDPSIRDWVEATEGPTIVQADSFEGRSLSESLRRLVREGNVTLTTSGSTLSPLGKALSDVAASAAVGAPKQGARTIDELEPDQQITLRDREQDTKLKGRYANVLLAMLGVQMLGADVVFVLFAAIGKHWNLSTGVIDVWLAATVVQMVTIVAIVVHYLFPNRDGTG